MDELMRPAIPEMIETERTVLQRLKYEDAEEIFYVYASKPEVTKYVAWPTHQSIQDTRAFLQYAVSGWNKGTDFSFSIRTKDSNRFIGTFGLLHDLGKIQFGYAIGPAYWRKGFATEVCSAVMSLLRNTPGIYRIGTFVDAGNEASIRVLQKSGLLEEARLTRWFRFVNQDKEPRDCILFKLPD